MELEYLLFTEKNILERVDEYTLYCFYLGYEPLINAKYSCPYREDDSPSWGVFEPTKSPTKGSTKAHEFMWADSGRGECGNIFSLIQKLFGYSQLHQALMKVCADFGLGGTNNDVPVYGTKIKKYADPVDIAIVSRPFTNRDLAWWKQFNITKDILEHYTTSALKCYWIAEQQKIPNYPSAGMGFAYREYDKYQLYFPLAAKDKKFRHNYTELCVHGFKQLTFDTELCIITKSRKDVMCLRSFGYNAVSPRSENTMLPIECINFLKRKYPLVKVLFDNDMKHKGDDYEFEKIYVPLCSGTKDTSDYHKAYGTMKTSEMLKQIIRL